MVRLAAEFKGPWVHATITVVDFVVGLVLNQFGLLSVAAVITLVAAWLYYTGWVGTKWAFERGHSSGKWVTLIRQFGAAVVLIITTAAWTLAFASGPRDRVTAVAATAESASLVVEKPRLEDDFALIRADGPLTLIKICYLVDQGRWVGQIQEMDVNGTSGTDLQRADSTATDITTCNSEFTDNIIASGNWIGLKTASLAGEPGRLNVTLYYAQQPP